MKILVVGETNFGSRTPQRVEALRRLGHEVTVVSTTPPGWTFETPPTLARRLLHRLRLPDDPAGASARMEAAARDCDVVLLDAAKMIRPQSLRRIKLAFPSLRLVWYSEDDMMNPRHRSRWLDRALGVFDLWVTTKSYNADAAEMPALGVRRVLVVDNSFDSTAHRAIDVSRDDAERFGADVSFVGTYETDRCRGMLRMAEAGISVRVWGNGWERVAEAHPLLRVEGRPVYGDDYRRVVAASRVNLCFLRKGNRDLQTCRSMEIPAMGGFMLHERSTEMERLLKPDVEAGYFGSHADLVTQCLKWLADDRRRERAAAAGCRRVWVDRHTHEARLSTILAAALEDK